jgi:hypothetical protein
LARAGLGTEDLIMEQQGPGCGAILQDYAYPGNDFAWHEGVESAEGCCQICVDSSGCEAWGYDSVSYRCLLKGGIPFGMMAGRQEEGWYAGNVIRPSATSMNAPALQAAPLTAMETPRSLSSPPPQMPPQGDRQPGVLGSIRGLLAGLFHRTPQASSSTLSPVVVPVFTTPPPISPLLVTTTAARCGLMDDGVDYPGNDLERVSNVESAELCCEECANNEECVAWSFQTAESVCFLKGASPRDTITKISNDDFTSGMPTQVGRSIEAIERPVGGSLYCFALIVPDTYETGLLEMQYDEGISLFDCDEYAVFTNRDLTIADKVEAIRVDSDLQCTSGGEFGTALNTDIFLTVWAKLLSLDRYSHHDWTVKVDADCAFSPTRLRSVLASYRESAEGVYLNNCMFGMHGPLEVMSRNAVRAFAAGRSTCAAQLAEKCGGPCQWGEDMYIDQCLQLLRVRREYEQYLLQEDHCEPPLGWDSCASPGVVAFHPFKDIDQYKDCISRMAS